ncbi:hypothetical protein D9613_000387 [Agrocybe pediades]|uniref:Uncharacterized protein n=1 Tax=Agrocybe pediades TaxID=84607 RepID=A0A8H4VT13_9AGAR|nr:hypothetical protein D9613_000387 [Agrocybe pediades]
MHRILFTLWSVQITVLTSILACYAATEVARDPLKSQIDEQGFHHLRFKVLGHVTAIIPDPFSAQPVVHTTESSQDLPTTPLSKTMPIATSVAEATSSSNHIDIFTTTTPLDVQAPISTSKHDAADKRTSSNGQPIAAAQVFSTNSGFGSSAIIPDAFLTGTHDIATSSSSVLTSVETSSSSSTTRTGFTPGSTPTLPSSTSRLKLSYMKLGTWTLALAVSSNLVNF